jgi:hypothetical protein
MFVHQRFGQDVWDGVLYGEALQKIFRTKMWNQIEILDKIDEKRSAYSVGFSTLKILDDLRRKNTMELHQIGCHSGIALPHSLSRDACVRRIFDHIHRGALTVSDVVEGYHSSDRGQDVEGDAVLPTIAERPVLRAACGELVELLSLETFKEFMLVHVEHCCQNKILTICSKDLKNDFKRLVSEQQNDERRCVIICSGTAAAAAAERETLYQEFVQTRRPFALSRAVAMNLEVEELRKYMRIVVFLSDGVSHAEKSMLSPQLKFSDLAALRELFDKYSFL